MKKKFSKIIFIVLIIVSALFFSKNIVSADSGSVSLEKLEIKVEINSDGSMDVTEIWYANIRNINTLYKTFEVDEEKYSSITDVKVVEKKNSKNYEFKQIDEEMYHVTENSFYALVNSDGKFEIAWGIGMDNSSGNKTYVISYTVNDAISKYNDYAELYWQFIGNDFSADIEKITGTITLPERVDNIEEIKVWGHTEGLNGEIYATGKDEIKFQINDYEAGNMVEVRSLFPTELINTSSRTYDEDIYESVIEEETKWAIQANILRQLDTIKYDILKVFEIYIILVICIIYIEKAAKYIKKLRKEKKYVLEQKIDYYRELPIEDATPGEALYLLIEPYENFSKHFGKIFSANILNLKLKGYIDLRTEHEENNKKEKIYIINKKLDKKENEEKQLLEEEKMILNFIRTAMKEKKEIEVKELEKYISRNSEKTQNMIKESKNSIEKTLSKNKLFDNTKMEEHSQYKEKLVIYYFMVALSIIFGLIPLSIIFLINGILCSIIVKNINVLTEEGVNLKQKWIGLKKYMQDFSLLEEKEVPAIEVWEKYLVYATAFGIANKVLEQLKTIYPNIDELKTGTDSGYMYFMYHSNFTTSFTNSINTSMSSASSSSMGSGGGFSGGGGGGRWSEVADGGR